MSLQAIKIEKLELDTKEKRYVLYLILSVLLHLSLLTGSALMRRFFPEVQTAAVTKPIEVEFLPTPTESKKTKQIVETELLEKSKESEKDAFLGAQNQVVQRQMKAQDTAAFRQAVKGGGAAQKTADTSFPKNLKLGDLGVKMNLKPMGGVGPSQVAATNDHLRDVKSGAQTLLNTKEFAYFSYYQRVRKQLEQFWEPGLRAKLKKMFERGRSIASDKEHSTKILVVMNTEGSITRVMVEETSGMMDLDQAAIEAFNKAGPFPNPPKGMIEADGTVKIEWEFVLKT